MNTWVDRRAIIFFCFAVVSFVLVWPCPEHFRWVGIVIGISYVVLGAMSWLDHLSRWKSLDRH